MGIGDGNTLGPEDFQNVRQNGVPHKDIVILLKPDAVLNLNSRILELLDQDEWVRFIQTVGIFRAIFPKSSVTCPISVL